MRLGNKGNSRWGGRVRYNVIPKMTHLALRRDPKKKKKTNGNKKWHLSTKN